MKLEYKKGDRSISINSQHLILPGEVWQVYEHDQRCLVVLHPRSTLRNVLCYDEKAQLLWTIDETKFFPQREGKGYDFVVREGPKQDGRLIAYCRNRPFYLDIATGKVTVIPGDFFW